MRTPSILLALLLLAAPAVAGGPFSDLDFDAAAAMAEADGKLLLVDFTATWCPPCKMMEKQTWPAEAVGAWVAAHAVAIQVDIDKERALAQRFAIQAIPTVVLLKDGAEADRHTGFMKPEALVAWGDDVLAGRSSGKAAAEKGASLKESEDVEARYDAARELLGRGEHDLALEHYLWLWPHTREVPRWFGVRLSFMLSDMARLAARHEPARKAFLEILDEAQRKVEGSDVPARLDWMEWSSLCEHFDQGQRIVAWYEARRDAAGRLTSGADPGVEKLVVGGVFDTLIEAGRPVDAVRLYSDVAGRSQEFVQDYKRSLDSYDGLPEAMQASLKEHGATTCRDGLATLYAAALADGRAVQAAAVAADLLATLDDAPSRLALVEWSLNLAPARPSQLAVWLDEAEKLGGDVTDLRAQLASPAPR